MILSGYSALGAHRTERTLETSAPPESCTGFLNLVFGVRGGTAEWWGETPNEGALNTVCLRGSG